MHNAFHLIYFVYAPIVLIVLLLIRYLLPENRAAWRIELGLLFLLGIYPVAALLSGVYGGSHVTSASPLIHITVIYLLNFLLVLMIRPRKLWSHLRIRRITGAVMLISRVWPLYAAYLFMVISHR